MLRFALYLIGWKQLRRGWPLLAAIGMTLMFIGSFLLFDDFDGVSSVSMQVVGYLLIGFGSLRIAVGLGHLLVKNTFTVLIEGGAWLVAGLVISIWIEESTLVTALVVAAVLIFEGFFEAVSAWVLRFFDWRWILGLGVVSVCLGAAVLLMWPGAASLLVDLAVGIKLLISGLMLLRAAVLLREMPAVEVGVGVDPVRHMMLWDPKIVKRIFRERRPNFLDRPTSATAQTASEPPVENPELLVHVWTGTDDAAGGPKRLLIDRYVAAMDADGKICTGHAALELKPDIYISHYRAEELDVTTEGFMNVLVATRDNDVPGVFLASHVEEVADWMEPTETIRFTRFNPENLRHFWEMYRQDSTYNLTNRNCSVTVSFALDAAFEGALAHRGLISIPFLLINPHLWIANKICRYAETSAWTPGLILDYARAMHKLLEDQESV